MTIKYYNVFDDLKAYPDAWLYVVTSMRGPGKTYSFFNGCLEKGIKFLYLKRTQIDIELLSSPHFNPLSPINRDRKTNYMFERIYDGISGIYRGDEDGNAAGECLGYAMSLSSIHKYKGFDLSEVDYMCLDEFIPQLSERVNHSEGNLLLDLYLTVNRDREARGRPALKLILFANATELYCPITDTLQIVDDLSEMNAKNVEFRYDEERKILLHRIQFSASANEDSAIYNAMKKTKWAKMAFEGEFSYNDFSRVKKIPLKNMVCFCSVIYNDRAYYIYRHRENGLFYMCRAKGGVDDEYNLDIEADRRRFYLTYALTLRNEISDGNMFFSDYSAYNLIFNYNKIYKNL